MNRMGYPQAGYDPAVLLEEISCGWFRFFAGVSWDGLGPDGKQWPVNEGGSNTKILHTERFKIGKGHFVFTDFVETPEPQGDDVDEYPFILTAGRRLQHYNCGSMTRRTPLLGLVDHDELLINPLDTGRYDIVDGDEVLLRSRQGRTHLQACLSDEVRPGVLFTTFHFPGAAINHLTSGVLDQDSMTPEFKVVAVFHCQSIAGVYSMTVQPWASRQATMSGGRSTNRLSPSPANRPRQSSARSPSQVSSRRVSAPGTRANPPWGVWHAATKHWMAPAYRGDAPHRANTSRPTTCTSMAVVTARGAILKPYAGCSQHRV